MTITEEVMRWANALTDASASDEAQWLADEMYDELDVRDHEREFYS